MNDDDNDISETEYEHDSIKAHNISETEGEHNSIKANKISETQDEHDSIKTNNKYSFYNNFQHMLYLFLLMNQQCSVSVSCNHIICCSSIRKKL